MKTINEMNANGRLLIETELKPLQGSRFQPTGFPDLGAATYTLADGTDMLLLESAQSMANRLEEVCWNSATDSLADELVNLPYVSIVNSEGRELSNSLLESHRVNSPYILEGKDQTFMEMLKNELKTLEKGRVDLKHFAAVLFKYDPNTLIHGIFLAKKDLAGGRLRLPRVLSSFVEAEDVLIAASGGVKLDNIDPKGETKKGFGHVPFSRDEYTAKKITAYFNIDLDQIRGFGLPDEAANLLLNLALLKIRKLLSRGLRFRTACDLEVISDVEVKMPKDFALPELNELKDNVKQLIEECDHLFAKPSITKVTYDLS